MTRGEDLDVKEFTRLEPIARRLLDGISRTCLRLRSYGRYS